MNKHKQFHVRHVYPSIRPLYSQDLLKCPQPHRPCWLDSVGDLDDLDGSGTGGTIVVQTKKPRHSASCWMSYIADLHLSLGWWIQIGNKGWLWMSYIIRPRKPYITKPRTTRVLDLAGRLESMSSIVRPLIHKGGLLYIQECRGVSPTTVTRLEAPA